MILNGRSLEIDRKQEIVMSWSRNKTLMELHLHLVSVDFLGN